MCHDAGEVIPNFLPKSQGFYPVTASKTVPERIPLSGRFISGGVMALSLAGARCSLSCSIADLVRG